MTSLLQDLRHTLRGLARSPGFAAAAIGTLALAIGANTAIFSVVRGVLLKPLPFASPERLVRVEERGDDGLPSNTGYATFLDWKERARSFSAIAVIGQWRPTLASSSAFPAERVEGLRVSDGFFRMLGVAPALGRDFLSSEDRPGGDRAVILSDALWRTRFGADPSIVGKVIRLGETPQLVAGVLPADFESVFSAEADKPALIFAPLRYDASLPQACRTCRHLRALARLAPGVTPAGARAEMTALSERLSREHPTDYAATGAFVHTLPETLTRPVRPALWSLLGAVGLVLLIGCANVASLLLARAGRRGREVAVRTALGAPRRRIAALFLIEAVVLALAGGALGLLVASWALQMLLALAPASLPRLPEIRLDGGVLLYTLGVSLATGLLFGLGPALSMSRRHAEPALRESGRGSAGRGPRRFAGWLVVVDVALALVLLSAALLLTESASRLLGVRPGFRADGLLTMEVDVSGARYDDEAALGAFWDQVLERTAALPGVTGVGLVSQLPLGGSFDSFSVHAQDKPSANPETDPGADRYSISAGYLRTMGIPVLRGRGIEASDRRGAAPVVLVNDELARRVWPGEDPIGKHVQIGGTDGPWRTVVGVAGTVRHTALDAPATPQIYLPRSQFQDASMVLVLRADRPERLAAAVRSAIAAIDPNQPVTHAATMPQIVAASAAPRRFSARLLAAFALLAAVLAAVGIFGVVAALVGQRAREIGIRIALGATRRQVVALVGARTLAQTLAGIALGLLVWLVVSPSVAGQLFGVTARDPRTLASASLLILGTAALSSLLPTRRAARIDPIAALRIE